MVASNEFNPADVTKGDQFTSFNVDDFPVPHGRDEVWRFIALRHLRGLHNGEFAPAVAQKISVTTPAGVSTETVAPDDARLGTAGAPADRVAAQAWTSMPEAQIVTIDADAQVNDPVEITITGAGEGSHLLWCYFHSGWPPRRGNSRAQVRRYRYPRRQR